MPSQLRPPTPSDDLADWTVDSNDIARYRALLQRHRDALDEGLDAAPARAGMEIGAGKSRGFRGLIAYVLFLVIAAAVFVLLFREFTANLRVALVIVAAMLVYMLVMARMAEGRFDARG